MFSQISKLKDDLIDGLKNALMGNLGASELRSLENEWLGVLEQTIQNLPAELKNRVHKEFNLEKVKQLYYLITKLNLLVVNSDPYRSNSHLEPTR